MKKRMAIVWIAMCMAVAAGCGGEGGTEPSGNRVTDGAEEGGADDLGSAGADGADTLGSDGTDGLDGMNGEAGAVDNPVAGGNEEDGTDGGGSLAGSGEENPQEEVLTLRIVDGAGTGNLILAGEGAGEVYTLSVEDVKILLDGAESDASVLEDGMMAEIRYTGGIMETFPGQIGDAVSVSVFSRGSERNPLGTFYDLCGFYLQVLNDLWDVDSGLNGGAVYVSVDLSEAPGELTDGEKEAVAWIFAGSHDAQPLTLTYGELAEQGYLSEYGDFEDGEQKIYEWTDGVLFSITAKDSEEAEIYSLPVLQFDAEKWRTPLGAYFYVDCKAVWSEGGSWSGYSVGAEAIS